MQESSVEAPARMDADEKREVTSRLQRYGVWKEASAFKEEERKRLRAEGKSREDANNSAWEKMQKQYDPCHKSAWMAALAKYSPIILPDNYTSDPPFNSVWFVYFTQAARGCFLRCSPPDLERAETVMMCAYADAPDEVSRGLLYMTVADPRSFFKSAGRIFGDLKQHYEDSPSDDSDSDVTMLEWALGMLPLMWAIYVVPSSLAGASAEQSRAYSS